MLLIALEIFQSFSKGQIFKDPLAKNSARPLKHLSGLGFVFSKAQKSCSLIQTECNPVDLLSDSAEEMCYIAEALSSLIIILLISCYVTNYPQTEWFTAATHTYYFTIPVGQEYAFSLAGWV